MQNMVNAIRNVEIALYVVANLALLVTCQVTQLRCPKKCGHVSVPYPFGLKEGCALDEDFRLHCNHTHHPPQPFFSQQRKHPITNISLDGYLRTYTHVARDCYNETGANIVHDQPLSIISLYPSSFSFSPTRNKLFGVGCDTIASLKRPNNSDLNSTIFTLTECASHCDEESSVINGSCSGVGCCQNMIPQQQSIFQVTLASSQNHFEVWSFNPCSYAFVSEAEYVFSERDLHSFAPTVPTIIDWAIGDKSCKEASKNKSSYACKEHSECRDYDSGPGYRCYCLPGYSGNPYVSHGCVDVNECEDPSLNNCSHKCYNIEGSYTCSCPSLFRWDGKRNGDGCTWNEHKIIPIIIGAAILISLLVAASLCFCVDRRKKKQQRLKEGFFKQNGGLILLDKMSRKEVPINIIRIFKSKELKEATDNFSESRICGRGGFGTVYKGYLSDGSIVAIKQSKIMDKTQMEQFINEIAVLSQINHRNVVRFVGCCLETPVPLLVYEFITNGTLSEHIHTDGNKNPRMPWHTRLKIAAETAGVLAYLHSAHSTPIIHRDIKPTNILLDENYTAKVSDFGNSKLNAQNQTLMHTMVQGTIGYLDPEYLQTSQLTEKSDVYSFGVVLIELLTGLKAVSFLRSQEDRSLAYYFLSFTTEDGLLEILDKGMMNEDNIKEIKEAAKIAKKCLRVKGEERPTMKDVAMELEGLLKLSKHECAITDSKAEESGEFYNISTHIAEYSGTGYESLTLPR